MKIKKQHKQKAYQAVLFDCGNTLLTYRPRREKIFASALKDAGYAVKPAYIEEAYRAVNFWMRLSSVKVKTLSERRLHYDLFHGKICEYIGLTSEIKKLKNIIRQKFEQSHGKWFPDPEAKKILKSLKENGIPAGVVANWDATLEQKCGESGLLPYLQFVIASADQKIEKPDPEIFKVALKRLGCLDKPSNVLYVGDDYQLDVCGASSAGLKAVLIDPQDRMLYADCLKFHSLKEFFLSMDFKKREVCLKL